ncbi:uncharacterized protein N7479_003306 [Penicillium vulpinum]|uniref:uncharacterized protein n=1 Tax=Penicillium vulpinum TaxID=29845 RepID=UPI00254872FC|nr:uncharacterized protein N7479_003306 [Penicillium vulpinum]KAJ5963430.1 hypothetical protein N7479_003306 [Penicillium vulpinum]
MSGRVCPQHGASRERRIDPDYRDIYVQICKPGGNGAIHWMIVIKWPGADRGTRLHSVGSKGNRQLSIESDKRFDSASVETTHYLGQIYASESPIVRSEAKRIPLQSCQLWACYLILRLERKGLLQNGLYDHYMNCYSHRRDEDYGPGHDIECRAHYRY